jgi:hypothetical protein
MKQGELNEEYTKRNEVRHIVIDVNTYKTAEQLLDDGAITQNTGSISRMAFTTLRRIDFIRMTLSFFHLIRFHMNFLKVSQTAII